MASMDGRSWRLGILLIPVALALAGCAEPDEATGADDDADDDAIVVNGAVYECDDTFDLDGICEEYEYEADEQAPGAPEVTPEADGTLVVDGRTYVCEDVDNVDVGANDPWCETYALREEA